MNLENEHPNHDIYSKIGKHLFTNEFTNYLREEMDLDIQYVKSCIIQAFNKEMNQHYNSFESLSSEESKEVYNWLTKCIIFHPKSGALTHRKKTVTIPNISIDEFSKINQTAQFHCPICTSKSNVPVQIIPIRISALSRQSSTSVQVTAFKRAIASYFSQKELVYNKNIKLCVQLIFALSPKNKDKDLDNMAKSFMDALQNNLFENDNDVDHLSLLKFKTHLDDPFVYISIRQTRLNEQNTVLFNESQYTWGNVKFMDLKDYLP